MLWGKAVIMEIEGGAKRVWEDLSSVTELKSHCTGNIQCFSMSIGTWISQKNFDSHKGASPKLLSSQLTNWKIWKILRLVPDTWFWVGPTVAHCSGRLSSPETHKSANPKISLTEPGNSPVKISFLSSDHIFLTLGVEQHLYSKVFKECSQTYRNSAEDPFTRQFDCISDERL